MRVLTVLALSVSTLAAAPVFAEPPAPDAAIAKLLACDYADGAKARLRCFEAALRAVRETHPEAAAMAEAEREEIARLASAQKENEFGLNGRDSEQNAFAAENGGAPASPPQPPRAEAEEVDRIESVSVAAGRNNSGRVFVVLENGQIWKQLKSDSSRPILRGDGEGLPVTIRKGALGSFFIKIGGAQAFRAERIK